MKKISLIVLLTFIINSSLLAQNDNIAIIDNITIKHSGNDKDILELTGTNFQNASNVRIEPLKNQTTGSIDYQWLIIIPNADVSSFLRDQITGNGGVYNNSQVNALAQYKVEVAATKSDGALKSTVLIRAKIDPASYVEQAELIQPVEDIAENSFKEIVFQRGFVAADQRFIDSKNSQGKPSSQDLDLGVPILRINIIGADGAKNIIESKATQLSIFLNEQRREEISQKFGIQFFVNNISLKKDLVLPKTIIYYRYDEKNQNLRFLKEALYIAKLIPSESVLKPMVDQQNKANLDIEIYVGRNLR